MVRVASGTKGAAEAAKGVARAYVPSPVGAVTAIPREKLLQGMLKLGAEASRQMSTGGPLSPSHPFYGLYQRFVLEGMDRPDQPK